jgi:putative addiction module component (TIGR02574 family)
MAVIDISTLTVEQRLELLDEIWESLSQEPDAIPLTEAQREELDRRIEDLDREGPVGKPLEQVLREIETGSE